MPMPFISRPICAGRFPARLVIGSHTPPFPQMRTPGNTLHESVSSAFPFNLTSFPDLIRIFRFPLPFFFPFARDGEKYRVHFFSFIADLDYRAASFYSILEVVSGKQSIKKRKKNPQKNLALSLLSLIHSFYSPDAEITDLSCARIGHHTFVAQSRRDRTISIVTFCDTVLLLQKESEFTGTIKSDGESSIIV